KVIHKLNVPGSISGAEVPLPDNQRQTDITIFGEDFTWHQQISVGACNRLILTVLQPPASLLKGGEMALSVSFSLGDFQAGSRQSAYPPGEMGNGNRPLGA